MTDKNFEGLLVSKQLVTPNVTSCLFNFNLLNNQSIQAATVGISGFKYEGIKENDIVAFAVNDVKIISENTVSANISFSNITINSFIYLTCIVFYSNVKTDNPNVFLTNIAKYNQFCELPSNYLTKKSTFIAGLSYTLPNSLKEIHLESSSYYVNKKFGNDSISSINQLPVNTSIGIIAGSDNFNDYAEIISGEIISGEMYYKKNKYNEFYNEISHQFKDEISDFAFLIKNISFSPTEKNQVPTSNSFYCNFEKGKEPKILEDNKTVYGVLNSQFYNKSSNVFNNIGLNIQYTLFGINNSAKKNNNNNNLFNTPNNSYTNSIMIIEELDLLFIVSDYSDVMYVTEIINGLPPSINSNQVKEIQLIENVYIIFNIHYYKYIDMKGFIHYFIILFFQSNRGSMIYYQIGEFDISTYSINWQERHSYTYGENSNSSICNNLVFEVHLGSDFSNVYYSLGKINVTEGEEGVSINIDYLGDNIKENNKTKDINFNRNGSGNSSCLFYNSETNSYFAAYTTGEDSDKDDNTSLYVGNVDPSNLTLSSPQKLQNLYDNQNSSLIFYNKKYLFYTCNYSLSSVLVYNSMELEFDIKESGPSVTIKKLSKYTPDGQLKSSINQQMENPIAIYKNYMFINISKYIFVSTLYENDLNPYYIWYKN